MPTYILDLLIRRAQIKEACNRIYRPVWLRVKSDGVQQAFNTKQIPPAEVLQFESPARLILNLPDIQDSVLQVSLCTLNESYNQTIVIASSQILLRTLPFGNPKTISFPLMSTSDLSKTAAIVTMTTTISELLNSNEQQKQPYQTYYNPPPPSQPQYYNPPPIYQTQGNWGQQGPPSGWGQRQNNQPPSYYNQEPNQYYNQPTYSTQNYRQPTQMDYANTANRPVNPYRSSNQDNQRNVHYPPFPPLEPDSSVFQNFNRNGMQFQNQAQTPRVIHPKRGRK